MPESTSGDLKYPQSWCPVNKTQWISCGLWPRKIKESPIPGQGINSLHSRIFPDYAGDSRRKTFKLVIWHVGCVAPFLGSVSKCLLTPDMKLMKDQNNYTTKLHHDEPVSLREGLLTGMWTAQRQLDHWMPMLAQAMKHRCSLHYRSQSFLASGVLTNYVTLKKEEI